MTKLELPPEYAVLESEDGTIKLDTDTPGDTPIVVSPSLDVFEEDMWIGKLGEAAPTDRFNQVALSSLRSVIDKLNDDKRIFFAMDVTNYHNICIRMSFAVKLKKPYKDDEKEKLQKICERLDIRSRDINLLTESPRRATLECSVLLFDSTDMEIEVTYNILKDALDKTDLKVLQFKDQKGLLDG